MTTHDRIERLRAFLVQELGARQFWGDNVDDPYVAAAVEALEDFAALAGEQPSIEYRRHRLLSDFADVVDSGGSEEAKSALPFLCAALAWAINQGASRRADEEVQDDK